jgi:flagellin FlaB
VLINTAGFLQSQAEATGEESTDQVSNAIQVVSTTGIVEDSSDPSSITDIRLLVSLAPGSDPIDTTRLSIETIGPGGESFTDVGSGTRTGNADDIDVLSNPNEKVELSISPSLSEGEEAQITITTGDGAQTTVVASVPEPLTSDDRNGAVRL